MTIRRTILGLFATACTLSASAVQHDNASYNFRVLLDNKPIGYHQFDFSQTEDVKQVASEARFDVKLLFITAFKYRHSSSEQWSNNCLTEIEANTNSNGKRQAVSGSIVNDSLKIDSSSGTQTVDGCVQTFAYWNPSILEASRLLNSQNGDYVDVEVTPLGSDTLNLDGSSFDARKYKLKSAPDYEGKPVDITLWYEASDMKWLALESVANGDRILRYELTDPPASTKDAASPSTGVSAAR